MTHRQAWDKVKRAVERERLRALRHLNYTMTTLDKLQLTLSLVSDPKQIRRIEKLILKEGGTIMTNLEKLQIALAVATDAGIKANIQFQIDNYVEPLMSSKVEKQVATLQRKIKTIQRKIDKYHLLSRNITTTKEQFRQQIAAYENLIKNLTQS